MTDVCSLTTCGKLKALSGCQKIYEVGQPKLKTICYGDNIQQLLKRDLFEMAFWYSSSTFIYIRRWNIFYPMNNSVEIIDLSGNEPCYHEEFPKATFVAQANGAHSFVRNRPNSTCSKQVKILYFKD